MNNLLSYCGLTDARMSASEKDLPVIKKETLHQKEKCYVVFIKWQDYFDYLVNKTYRSVLGGTQNLCLRISGRFRGDQNFGNS